MTNEEIKAKLEAYPVTDEGLEQAIQTTKDWYNADTTEKSNANILFAVKVLIARFHSDTFPAGTLSLHIAELRADLHAIRTKR